MNWSVELVIALIGAITGISSLLIQFFEYWKSRPKVKLEEDASKPGFYFFNNQNTFETDNDYRKSELIIVIPLIISNNSTQSITIEKLEVKHQGGNIRLPITDDVMKNNPKYHADHDTYFEIPLGESFHLPYRMGGYDSLSGNIKTSWLTKEHLDTSGILAMEIKLHIPGEIIIKEIFLNEFTNNTAKNYQIS